MKILITAPSLEENRNVSGISSVVRQIVGRGSCQYEHFIAGSEDGEPRSAGWILKQLSLPLQFFRRIKSDEIDLVHLNTALNPLSIVRDFALAKAAKAARKPLIIHVHGGKFLAREFENNFVKNLARQMLETADAVLVLSELEKQVFKNRRQNLRVKVLENAVALDEAQFPARDRDQKTIIFLGRMTESKGLHEIVEAVKTLRGQNYRFNFRAFGAGDLEKSFTAQMSEILGDKFYFGGIVAGADKWRELAKSDVFLLPSRHGEGLPMAMLEAMAAGCAVVVSEMASIGAVVSDGVNGFLVEPENAAQIVAKLKVILRGEINLDEIQKNARRTIAEKYDVENYLEKLEAIYAEVVSLKNSR